MATFFLPSFLFPTQAPAENGGKRTPGSFSGQLFVDLTDFIVG